MAGALQWDATLRDGMSAPARAGAAGLGALTEALRTSGIEAERAQRKQEASLRASAGKDAIAKLQARQKAEEGGARSDFLANMARHDTIRADVDTTGLKKAKAEADAAARSMDKLRASARAAAGGVASISEGRGSFRGGSVGKQSLIGPPPPTAGFARFLQILSGLGPTGRLASEAIIRVGGSLGKAGDMASKLSGPLKAVGGALLSVGSMAAQAGAALAAIFAAGALAIARYVTQIQSFKQSTMFAFSALLGGQSQAVAGWARVQAAAASTGTDLMATGAAFNSLLGQGFKLDEVDTLFKRMADLKTLNPATNIEGIARAISQIKATGKLQGDELMQLNEAGLSSKLVYEELAKSLGKTVPEIKKMQEAGKITDKQAIDAIQAAIAKQTGGKPPGALAAEATSKTLVGALGKMGALAQIFASNLNIDFSPIVRFLERVGSVLTGGAGKKFGASIEDGFAGVLGILDSITEKDIAAGFDVASGIIRGVADTARDIAATVATIDSWMAAIGAKTSVWSAIFNGIGGALRGIGDVLLTVIGGPFIGFLKETYDWCMLLVEAFQRVSGSASSLGSLSLPGVGNANAAGGEASGNALADAIRQLTGGPAQPGAPSAAAAGVAAAPPPAPKNITKTFSFNAVGITDAQFVEKVKAIIREEDAAGGDDD